MSLASTLSFNKYKAGKIIDGETVTAGSKGSYVAFDMTGRYSFRHILKSKVIDPLYSTWNWLYSYWELPN